MTLVPPGPASATLLRLPNDQDASGRSFDDTELSLVAEVLRSGTLTSTKGTMVTRFEDAAARLVGSTHAVACASGSAAVHCAAEGTIAYSSLSGCQGRNTSP